MSAPAAPKRGWLAHYRELVAAWRRKGMHEDSEDAMQDAVLRLLEAGSAAVTDPAAYLKRSVANGVIDRHRHQAVLPMTPLHELAENEHPASDGPDAQLASQRLAGALKAALGELPLVCQQVYVRQRLEGWTHDEIARAMGISKAMVQKHMTRALQHLNRKLQEYAP
ncbi:sigma-70 family RNA polymerase sigma factor [Bordetella genomosp. 12]|uniref:RNA polymerase ECF-subfamily sigma-70 factor n=1 Tax=Bordetella genomosp. 12 TaxID=463035 RepID=A0A261VFD8_9BORD|nr:sigma-70 family RNA polymerase sigma factor [Bordetella genomosp. 12]OZI71873.1 RNA polymerase ECF-subfamily sigma-70 factor [Bordetella genomosp. 12]